MKNILLRKKKYFGDGGNDGIIRLQPQSQIPTSQFSNVNMQHVAGVPKKGIFKNGTDVGGIIGGALFQLGETAYSGASIGSNNLDQGKLATQKGQFDFSSQQASNVGQTYSAGQNQLNLLSKTGPAATAQDLKTHKGWKNVLGTTGKGAAVGSTIGSAIMPGIGTAIGAAAGAILGGVASGIGELFGARKRKKRAEELAKQKRATDYDVDYYNSKQAEQLASANDQAAKIQADENRRNVLALAAYGGRLKRKNYLINNRHIV